ncbi:hypothetical protein ACQJBY_028928 [Aegilops geniculata]
MERKATAHVDSRGEEGHGGRSLLLQCLPRRPHGEGQGDGRGSNCCTWGREREGLVLDPQGCWIRSCLDHHRLDDEEKRQRLGAASAEEKQGLGAPMRRRKLGQGGGRRQ